MSEIESHFQPMQNICMKLYDLKNLNDTLLSLCSLFKLGHEDVNLLPDKT